VGPDHLTGRAAILAIWLVVALMALAGTAVFLSIGYAAP
jgi:hypothetical protein